MESVKTTLLLLSLVLERSESLYLRIRYRIDVLSGSDVVLAPTLVNGAIHSKPLRPIEICTYSMMVAFLFLAVVLVALKLTQRTLGLGGNQNLFLTLFFSSVAIWALCSTKIIELLIDNWPLVHNLEYIALYILPFSVWAYLSDSWELHSRLVHIQRV